MKDTIKYLGLYVSKEKIAVAVADEGRGEPRYWGMIPHTPEAIRKLVKNLGGSPHCSLSEHEKDCHTPSKTRLR